jgi:hypothetical protein
MAEGTVRVKGLRELQSAFRRIDAEAATAVRKDLVETAQPVADAARGKISRYPGASLGTIRLRATTRSVFVTQGKRKVTGRRGDFGALQMRVGLIPALAENSDQIVRGVEQTLDRLASSNGF